MFKTLNDDIQAVAERDPAARSKLEVLLCYPGLHAVLIHRVAHRLWRRGWLLTARVLSQFSRWLTGIEIRGGRDRAAPVDRSRHGGGDRRDRGGR